MIGSGMSSGVSRQAYPNIRPWSPAPWRSSSEEPSPSRYSKASVTPWAMSGDWEPIETDTPQERPSYPLAEES